jgi:predicted metalloprotease with PDZ domain
VRIRERTGNRRSLDDALRALITQGGTIAAHWRLSQVLEVGDRAVGVRVLEDLHEEMGSQPLPVDLDALFRRLGAAVRGGEVVFDDRAPLASIRAAITSSGGQFRR